MFLKFSLHTPLLFLRFLLFSSFFSFLLLLLPLRFFLFSFSVCMFYLFLFLWSSMAISIRVVTICPAESIGRWLGRCVFSNNCRTSAISWRPSLYGFQTIFRALPPSIFVHPLRRMSKGRLLADASVSADSRPSRLAGSVRPPPSVGCRTVGPALSGWPSPSVCPLPNRLSCPLVVGRCRPPAAGPFVQPAVAIRQSLRQLSAGRRTSWLSDRLSPLANRRS